MICNKCKIEKSEERFEFRKDRGCFRTICKDCKNSNAKNRYPDVASKLAERRKELRDKNLEEFNSKARKRYWKNRDNLVEKAKNRTKKSTSYSSAKKWRSKNKHKCAAHQCVNRALKSERLTKPKNCQICGMEVKLHAHHADYLKPLDIIWLCIPCHKKVHSKYFN